ncbi:unnamed protein product [Amoebophrya sp. A25]|nr:unnamed protein product [Amoebophrya sp. A25]|eukprot:GSA25T00000648001.1
MPSPAARQRLCHQDSVFKYLKIPSTMLLTRIFLCCLVLGPGWRRLQQNDFLALFSSDAGKDSECETSVHTILVSAAPAGNYNMWSCPHCYEGGMAAEVSDLSCEDPSYAPSTGDDVPWRTLKTALFQLVEDAVTSAATSHGLEKLIPYLDMAMPRSRCYLGLMCLNFVKVYLHPPEDRLEYFQTTKMGGTSFKKLIPLSYWDVLNSGWPLFSILDILGQLARYEANVLKLPAPRGWGISGLSMDMEGFEDTPFKMKTAASRNPAQQSQVADGDHENTAENRFHKTVQESLRAQLLEHRIENTPSSLGTVTTSEQGERSEGALPYLHKPKQTAMQEQLQGHEQGQIQLSVSFSEVSKTGQAGFFGALLYLAEQEHVSPCHGGPASAYFTLAETLIHSEAQYVSSNSKNNRRNNHVDVSTTLGNKMFNSNFNTFPHDQRIIPPGSLFHMNQMPQSRESVRNATKNFVLLGEAQVHNCQSNMTVYHHLRSDWNYFGVLSRIERRRVLPVLFGDLMTQWYTPPPPAVEQTERKYSDLKSSVAKVNNEAHESQPGGAASTSAVTSSTESVVEDGHSWQSSCFGLAGRQDDSSLNDLIHIAVSADVKQIDGFIVALNSLVRKSANSEKTCVHVFLREHELEFIAKGLQCAFGERMETREARSGGHTHTDARSLSPLEKALQVDIQTKGETRPLTDDSPPSTSSTNKQGYASLGTFWLYDLLHTKSDSSKVLLSAAMGEEQEDTDEDGDAVDDKQEYTVTDSSSLSEDRNFLQQTAHREKAPLPVLLHRLDEEMVGGLLGPQGGDQKKRFRVGASDFDVSKGFLRDTGNLSALHNYVRFFLHRLLPRSIRHVLYFDVDILIGKDPRQLWEEYMPTLENSRATVCAAIRPSSPLFNYLPGVLYPHTPEWVPMNNPAFNAGVLFLHLDRWRERPLIQAKLDAWVASRDNSGPETLWRHGSQPLMLLLFHDEACKLPHRWNVDGLGHRLNYPKPILEDGGLFHWTGPLKPWLVDGVNRRLWEPYTVNYCPRYSFRVHTTTCRPDSWYC